LANAQTNLVVNPSFETWTNGTSPDSWTVPANSTHAGSFTAIKETSLVANGTSSLRLEIGTTQNPGFAQLVTLTPGKTYTLSFSYYVVSGDGTDARIWCNFKNSTTYFTETELVATGLYSKLRGPGAESSSSTLYFPDIKGSWQSYSTEFTAPANATELSIECRSYKSSTVIWDNFSLTEKPTGLISTTAEKLNLSVSNNKLSITSAPSTNVEIFNTVGAKVKNLVLVNNEVDLNLAKGVYIVRCGNATGKIML
jgi:hypothetical protein